MSRKLWSLLLVFLLTLILLQTNKVNAYEPLVTIGKPALRDILYSPDGRFLATVTRTYLELLDAETFAPVARADLADGYYRLAFSPDSSLVAISGYDEGIQIWRVDSEMFLATIPVRARAAEFSPDGKYLAYANGDSVFLWDVEKRETVRELTGDPQPSFKQGAEPRIRGITFHPDSRTLAVGSDRCTVSLWDVETAKLLSYLELESEMYPNIMTFSHDGSLLAAASPNTDLGSRIHLWDISTGDLQHKFGRFESLAFTPDDRYLLAGGVNGNLHVIQIDTFSVEKIPAVHQLPPPNYSGFNALECITFHPDGQKFATLINETRARIWNAQDFSWMESLYGYSYPYAEALYLPKINRIVTGIWSDVLCFWDAASGELVGAAEFFEDIPVLKAAPDGRRIAFAPYHMENQVWDADSMKPLLVLERGAPEGGPTEAIAFSPSGKYLASNGWRGTFVWNARTGEEVNWIYNGWSDVQFLLFTSDERQILIVPPDEEKTEFWDVETGELVDKTGHIGPMVNAGADFVQARRRGDTIEIYMLRSGKRLGRIPDVPEIPDTDTWKLFQQSRFHPSGNVLAVRYDETEEYRFYNVWTGELLSTVSGIVDLQFADDGEHIFMVDDKRQLGLYRISDILGRQVSSVFTVHAFDKITTFGQIKQDQLLQNYPNPFNPETWIPYQLRNENEVTVCIHDSTGKLMRTFFLGNKNAGAYVSQLEAVHWDGKDNAGQNLASGVYFYSIQAGDFSGFFRAFRENGLTA